jgi:endonuclease-8
LDRTLKEAMPEGDTIHYAANRMRPVLVGNTPEIVTPHARHGRDRWPERLANRAVTGVDARGKHLFIRFEDDLVLHSHLRMTGKWKVHKTGTRWGRSARRAWLVLHSEDNEIVQFDGPVLELLTAARARNDPRIAQLGPDIVAEGDFDERRVLRLLRQDDPTRPIGDTLLDQRIVAGLGTIWRTEACFAAKIDPRRLAGQVDDERILEALRAVRPRMQRSAIGGFQARDQQCYGRAGRPCPRCGDVIQRGTLGDDNRPAYWCPGCQE